MQYTKRFSLKTFSVYGYGGGSEGAGGDRDDGDRGGTRHAGRGHQTWQHSGATVRGARVCIQLTERLHLLGGEAALLIAVTETSHQARSLFSPHRHPMLTREWPQVGRGDESVCGGRHTEVDGLSVCAQPRLWYRSQPECTSSYDRLYRIRRMKYDESWTAAIERVVDDAKRRYAANVSNVPHNTVSGVVKHGLVDQVVQCTHPIRRQREAVSQARRTEPAIE
jgi:hypothetical protein